jgi:hypothetical protein
MNKGDKFVLIGRGVATVAKRYWGVPKNSPEAEYQRLVDLNVVGRGSIYGLAETDLEGSYRPLVSPAEAYQLIGIIMNRMAPLSPVPLAKRLQLAQKALKQSDPYELARSLRELRMRLENKQGLPIRIHYREKDIRKQIEYFICGEIKASLGVTPDWFPLSTV